MTFLQYDKALLLGLKQTRVHDKVGPLFLKKRETDETIKKFQSRH